MTSSFLRAVWFACDTDAPATDLGRYLEDARGAGATDVALYRTDPGGTEMRHVGASLHRLDAADPAAHEDQEVEPTHMVLAAFPGYGDVLAAHPALSVSVVEAGDERVRPVSRSVFVQLTDDCRLGTDVAVFAPAVQFGAFSMQSVEDEWEISEWYRELRVPQFLQLRSALRVRRFVSVTGRPKYGILYEFPSLADRLAEFEVPMESLVRKVGHPSQRIVSRTSHMSFSPTVGERLHPL